MAQPVTKNNDGMTLVEVLVSLVIVFVIFLGLSGSGLVVLNENIKNEMRDEAVDVADYAVQKARRTNFDTLITTFDNLTEVVPRRIRNMDWNYTVKWKVNPLGTGGDADNVTITVTWPVRNQANDSSHTVATIVRKR